MVTADWTEDKTAPQIRAWVTGSPCLGRAPAQAGHSEPTLSTTCQAPFPRAEKLTVEGWTKDKLQEDRYADSWLKTTERQQIVNLDSFPD